MKIAFNYLGDMLIKDDSTEETKIYRPEERDLIKTAIYKWVQHKNKAGIYINNV